MKNPDLAHMSNNDLITELYSRGLVKIAQATAEMPLHVPEEYGQRVAYSRMAEWVANEVLCGRLKTCERQVSEDPDSGFRVISVSMGVIALPVVVPTRN